MMKTYQCKMRDGCIGELSGILIEDYPFFSCSHDKTLYKFVPIPVTYDEIDASIQIAIEHQNGNRYVIDSIPMNEYPEWYKEFFIKHVK